MADWSKPVITDLYQDVLDYLDSRLDDVATGFSADAVNIPIGTLRFDRATSKFQEWDGVAWVDKVLAIASGGTGAVNATNARVNLGLGTISVQNVEAVAITGGTITGLTTFNINCDLAFNTDGFRNIGSNGIRPNNVYIRNGLVIPVGTDKFVIS